MEGPSKAVNNSKSCSKCNNNVRFMQPLLPNFLATFSIPVAFEKVLEKELKKGHYSIESVVLTMEEEPHRHWVVKVSGGCHFREGWKDFCEHYGLKVGDFLVFTHQTHLLFQLVVFDPSTACLRNFYPISNPNNDHGHGHGTVKATKRASRFKFNGGTIKQEKDIKAPVQGSSSAVNRKLNCCQVTLTSYAMKSKTIYLPQQFIRQCGLANRSCPVKLIDGRGGSWQVKLNFRKVTSLAYIYGAGWKDFQIDNKLKPRDVLYFQLIRLGKRPIMKCYRLNMGYN